MCRNIKTLFNFEPPADDLEIESAAIQYIRKISGYNKPSEVNKIAFENAIAEIAASTKKLIESLETNVQPRDREIEAEKAKERNRRRFAAK